MTEDALLLGRGSKFVAIYSPPHEGTDVARTAVIMLNAGLVHHVGPHCLHVRLARLLAAQGVASLRMDFSGIGDSPNSVLDIAGEELENMELQCAIDELKGRGHDRVVLFGICSGAKSALRLVENKPVVAGVILVNQAVSDVDSDVASDVSAQYYMRSSAFRLGAWANFFTGKVDYSALFRSMYGVIVGKLSGKKGGMDKASLLDLLRNELQPVVIQGVPALVITSDRSAQYVQMIGEDLSLLEGDGLIRFDVFPEADHIFTSLHEQEMLYDCIQQWIATRFNGPDQQVEEDPSRETLTL